VAVAAFCAGSHTTPCFAILTCRPKDELLEKPLGRLQKSAAPQLDKKQQRLKGKPAAAATATNDSAAAPLFVGLHAGPSPAFPVLDATSVTNEEAWADGRLLRVGEQQYRVDLNPPLLDQVVLHGRPFVGIPLVPAVQLHFADEAACQWQWQRQAPGGAWQPLPGATRRRYVPLPEDAGCLLRVQCTPGRHVWATEDAAAAGTGAAGAAGAAGRKQELVVLGAAGWAQCSPVEVPPSPAAAAPRHELTQQATSPPLLRVVTYNILADQYAATETAKNVIFAHCPPQ
jgi:2',5'-phosphodiesterase